MTRAEVLQRDLFERAARGACDFGVVLEQEHELGHGAHVAEVAEHGVRRRIAHERFVARRPVILGGGGRGSQGEQGGESELSK